jgi:ribosomal protein L30E
MTVREIKEAMDKGKVCFGIRQALKLGKKSKNVFVPKDVRDDTVEKLEAAGVEFDVLKLKEELAKELNLDFECEVFSIHQGVPHKGARK